MKNFTLVAAFAAFVTLTANPASGQVLAQWNFNGTSATTVPGGTSAPATATGSGTASLFGGATATFASGIASGGSSDPVITSPDNFAWNTTTYGANTNAGNAGAQFLISTVGFTSLNTTSFTFSYDLRHSNTASRFAQVLYTTNGTTWSDAGTFFTAATGDTWFNNRSVSITDSAAFNNPNFGVRVTTSNGSGSALVASTDSSTYAGTGTWRFDMVTLTAVPEPHQYALVVVGLLALFIVRWCRRMTA